MATQGVLGAATLTEFEDALHGELIRPGDGAFWAFYEGKLKNVLTLASMFSLGRT